MTQARRMQPPPPNTVGSYFLGNARAEADTLLGDAFVETAEYRILKDDLQHNFVVGRRGSGKSALCKQLEGYYAERKHAYIVVKICPDEPAAQAFYDALQRLGLDYRKTRSIARQLWRLVVLLSAASRINALGLKGVEVREALQWSEKHERHLGGHGLGAAWRALDAYRNDPEPASIGLRLSQDYSLDAAEQAVSRTLAIEKKRLLVLIDKLDEGWLPDLSATAAIGGLAALAAGLGDQQRQVDVLLFARDNMFRALSYFDEDFSRNIKNSSIRLRWTEEQLLALVTARLRIRLGMEGTESDIRVWNRFAHRDLHGREGFRECLRHTLYRPRDILSLLNEALVAAERAGRKELVTADIAASAKQISEERLADLQKEYDVVLPGLGDFIGLLRGMKAVMSGETLLAVLSRRATFPAPPSSDFAVLSDPTVRFQALYGVGLIGAYQVGLERFVFCHDGAQGTPQVAPASKYAIHPTYWKALELDSSDEYGEMLVEIGDDYEETNNAAALRDLRTQQLGQTMSDLGHIPEGAAGAAAFEEWVARAFKILFAPSLRNVELKPNGSGTHRRDIVATLAPQSEFWRRVREDYGTRELTIEAKNYSDPSADDFAQANAYLGKEHGRFAILVVRRENEGLESAERAQSQAYYHQHNCILFMVTTSMLVRALKKLRSPARLDYAEELFQKRLDTYIRSYLPIKSARHA